MQRRGGAMPGAADEMPLGDQGLSWSWGLDFDALMAALNEPAPWNRPAPVAPAPATASAPDAGDSGSDAASAASSAADADSASADAADPASAASADPAEAEFAELLEAMEQGRTREVPLTEVAGRIAESLPT